MGFMQRFERKLEYAVGNTFARVFGGKIVPAEVEDALQREASHSLQHLDGHSLAPNHYVLTVSESDEENLTSDTELTLNAFAKHLKGYIGEQGWETYGAVSVELESSPDLHTGQFRAHSLISPDDSSHASTPRRRKPSPPAPAPIDVPHPAPGVTQMPSEQHGASQPRYQPQQYQQQAYSGPQYDVHPQASEQQFRQLPPQAYSQRPPGAQPYPPQPQHSQYGEQQYQRPGPPEPGYAERGYAAPGYAEPHYPGSQYPDAQNAGAQHPAPEYPAPRYEEDPHPDPRLQPPAHLYPPQQQPAPMPPAPQQPGPPEPGQYPQPGYGYQDQAFMGEQYPLRDPAGDYYAAERNAAPQQAWAAQAPAVSLELGDGSGRNLELRHGSNIIGRGQDAHFRIPDTGVSRQHADIKWDGAVALVVDLQSTNGTVVNGTPVDEWQLADGDVIRIGHSDITVRFH